MAVAFLALLLALSGTAIALPGKNRADSGDLANDSVRGVDIRHGGVGSRDVKDGALLARDFRAGELRSGPQGVPGAQGATGPQGPTGAQGATGPPGDAGTAVAYAR